MSKDQSESEATNQNKDQTNVFSEINLNAPIKILVMKQKKDLRKEI